MSTSVEQKWLVKSDQHILGPFTTDEVEQLLQNKHIALIDEIRTNEGRWTYIRENKELQTIVDIVKQDLQSKAEPTRALQTNSSEKSIATQVSDVVSMVLEQIKSKNLSRENVETETKPSQSEQVADNAFPIRESEKSKKVYYEQRIKSGASTLKIFFIVVMALLILGAAVSSLVFYVKTKNLKEKELSSESFIKKQYEHHQDSKLIEALNGLNSEQRKKLLPQMLDVIPLITKNSSAWIAEVNAQTQLNKEQQVQVEMITFNKYVNEQKWSEAEAVLKMALQQAPRDTLVAENFAIVNYLKSNYELAGKSFLKLYQESDKGRFLYAAAVAFSQLNKKDELYNLKSTIEHYLVTHIPYKKELSWVLLNINFAQNFKNDIPEIVKIYKESPDRFDDYLILPRLVRSDFYKNLKLSVGKTDDELFQHLETSLDKKATLSLEVYRKIQIGEFDTAQKLFAESTDKMDKADQVNLQIKLAYFFKRYADVLEIEKNNKDFAFDSSSQLILIQSKMMQSKDNYTKNVEALKKLNNLLSLWAQLIEFKKTDLTNLKSFLIMNQTYFDDFQPAQDRWMEID